VPSAPVRDLGAASPADGYVAWRHTASVWDEEEAAHLIQAAIAAVFSNDT
jgi:hypothetical protein